MTGTITMRIRGPSGTNGGEERKPADRKAAGLEKVNVEKRRKKGLTAGSESCKE